MSGPKTSRYTLTPEQRRFLVEQRKIERRKAIATENIKRNSKWLLQIGRMFSNDKAVATELETITGNDGGFAEKNGELQQLVTSIEPIIAKLDIDDVENLEKTAGVLGKYVTKAEKLVKEITEIAVKNELTLRKNLENAIDQGFSSSFADIITPEAAILNDTKEKLRLQLIQMKKNSTLPAELINEIEVALEGIKGINNHDFLKNYSALTVTPLIKKCNNYLAEYAQYHEEFEALYTEYLALCELHFYVPQKYICCAESIETLHSEIERIKETIYKDDEQTYISECLDKVMEEMGYYVLGSREVIKKNGKHFRNELYTYGEGTAVNITYSSDGRIAMELGGIDATDRLPNEHETSFLCDAMDQFCEDFKEIEKRLLAKGVILAERISMLPPDAEFAQIINTTEYEMKTNTEKIQTKKQHSSTAKLKSMKKE